jgi:hypothetical protein|tara:strand:- start:854 stop:988 length:135 start_codon:yes stop_codon:yes gene_type:complete
LKEYDLEAELDANDAVLKKHNAKEKVTAKEKARAEADAAKDSAK